MTAPDTAAKLTSLAGWIDEQLDDETADRQWIAESAAAKVRDITLQMLGGAELAARAADPRVTAARQAIAEPGPRHDVLLPASVLTRMFYELRRQLGQVLDVIDGQALIAEQFGTLRQALGDAIARREPGGFCIDCDQHPAGLCFDHAGDLDLCDAYGLLAKALGVEL